MRVTVKFFAFKELAGRSEDEIELPDSATVADLAARLAEQVPAIFPLAERAVYLVDKQIANRTTVLHGGDSVLMLQMLGGG